jgi:glycyl-tRNA synthetase alpha chain
MIYFQDLLFKLTDFWRAKGCVIQQPFDIEVGAGTFHPATFFGVLGPNAWKCAYVQPSRRPVDGRYGDNPLRMAFYYQYQVILKPAPDDLQDLYLESLAFIGLDVSKHDFKFEKDDWKSPTQGAWGLGWQVSLDGMEISQFTYFQQMGGSDLDPVTGELTYGTERLCMFLQGVESAFDLKWNADHTYGDILLQYEKDRCAYNFEHSSSELLFKMFDAFEQEAKNCLKNNLVYPAYEMTCKCSNLFNLLDARRAISVTERERFMQRVQELSKNCARAYLKRLKALEETEAAKTA